MVITFVCLAVASLFGAAWRQKSLPKASYCHEQRSEGEKGNYGVGLYSGLTVGFLVAAIMAVLPW